MNQLQGLPAFGCAQSQRVGALPTKNEQSSPLQKLATGGYVRCQYCCGLCVWCPNYCACSSASCYSPAPAPAPATSGSSPSVFQAHGVSDVSPDQLKNFTHANRSQYYVDSQGNQYDSDGHVVSVNISGDQYTVDRSTGAINKYVPPKDGGLFSGALGSALGIGALLLAPELLPELLSSGGAEAGLLGAGDYAAGTAATQAALADAGIGTGIDAATAAGAGAGAGAADAATTAAASTTPASSALDSLNLMPSNQALTNAAIKTGLGVAQGEDPMKALEGGALSLAGGVVGSNVSNLVSPTISNLVDNSNAANAISQGIGTTAGQLATGNNLTNSLIGGVGTGVATELGPNGEQILSKPLAQAAGTATSTLLKGGDPSQVALGALIGAGGSMVGSTISDAINNATTPTSTDMSGFYTPTDTTSLANYQANQPSPDTTGLGSGNYNTDTSGGLDFLNNAGSPTPSAPASTTPTVTDTSQLADGSWKYTYSNGTWVVTDPSGQKLYDNYSQPTDASTVAPPSESSYTPSSDLENVDVASTSTSGQDTAAPPGEASYTPPSGGLPTVNVTDTSLSGQDTAAPPGEASYTPSDNSGLQTVVVTGQDDSSTIQPTEPDVQPIGALPSDFLDNIDTSDPLQTVEVTGQKPTDTTIQPTEPTAGDITPVKLDVNTGDTSSSSSGKTSSGSSSGTSSGSSSGAAPSIEQPTQPAFGKAESVLKSYMPNTQFKKEAALKQLYDSLDPELKAAMGSSESTKESAPEESYKDFVAPADFEKEVPLMPTSKHGGLIHMSGAGSVSDAVDDLISSNTPTMQSIFNDAQKAFQPTPMRAPASTGLESSTKYIQQVKPHQLQQLYNSINPALRSHLMGGGPVVGVGGMAEGGLPARYHPEAPEGHHPEFITGQTGYYAAGRGTGQSDDIPAMLHDGDYVIDADSVAQLGDGSSKAGAQALEHFRNQIPHHAHGGSASPVPAKIADGEYVLPAAFVTALGGGDNKTGSKLLDKMREELREHKRSAPVNKIPPKAKSPLDYLRMANHG